MWTCSRDEYMARAHRHGLESVDHFGCMHVVGPGGTGKEGFANRRKGLLVGRLATFEYLDRTRDPPGCSGRNVPHQRVAAPLAPGCK